MWSRCSSATMALARPSVPSTGTVNAAKLVMKDGRSVEGTIAKLGSIVQAGPGVDHKGGGGDLELILIVDDKLRLPGLQMAIEVVDFIARPGHVDLARVGK